jgi:hypothetical protein
MFMRVSSFLLSRAPTEQEVKETDAMVEWFRVAARLFDASASQSSRARALIASSIGAARPAAPSVESPPA